MEKAVLFVTYSIFSMEYNIYLIYFFIRIAGVIIKGKSLSSIYDWISEYGNFFLCIGTVHRGQLPFPIYLAVTKDSHLLSSFLCGLFVT